MRHHGLRVKAVTVLSRYSNMGFGSFVQVLRRRGRMPTSLLPAVARTLIHALKMLHALRHVRPHHPCVLN